MTPAFASPLASDLFGEPMLPGFGFGKDFITCDEEAALIAHLAGETLAPFRFQRWEGKRLTRSFGWTYDFESGRFAPGAPFPAWLVPLQARAARFARIAPSDLEQALLLYYGPGAGIGWHRDRPVFEHVIGVSLGTRATMRFRRRTGTRFERAAAALPPRSVYRLDGEARNIWEHSIAATVEPRWSITFRSLR